MDNSAVVSDALTTTVGFWQTVSDKISSLIGFDIAVISFVVALTVGFALKDSVLSGMSATKFAILIAILFMLLKFGVLH